MSREDPPLRIRLPETLKAKIQELAAESHRSMNAEIVARLERSLEQEAQEAGHRPFAWVRKARQDNMSKLEARIEALEAVVAELKSKR